VDLPPFAIIHNYGHALFRQWRHNSIDIKFISCSYAMYLLPCIVIFLSVPLRFFSIWTAVSQTTNYYKLTSTYAKFKYPNKVLQ